MAGAGFDARMIKQADRGMKDRIGRAAYLYTGARNLSAHRVKAVIEVDGRRFFKGRVSCVLAGNVGKVLGGVEAFHGAQPDDGLLELGVVTAGNAVRPGIQRAAVPVQPHPHRLGEVGRNMQVRRQQIRCAGREDR